MSCPLASTGEARTGKAPWAFLYWMPYDNDLSPVAGPIIDMLAKGARGSRAVVAVQSDTAAHPHMHRYVMTRSGVQREAVAAHDSSSGEELAQFLEWAAREVPAEHYVVVVLGHGGALTEISEDRSTRGWMRTRDVAAALGRLRAATGGARPALLYLQNCNKGTIETYYELRDCAHVTLAAQSLLGTPNYYYEPVLRWLMTGSSSATPMAVAQRIVEEERADMLATLVATDNFGLAELPERLNPLLEAVRTSRIDALRPQDVVTYAYPDAAGELHADLILLLAGLSSRLDAVRPHYMEFSTWLWNRMGARRIDGSLMPPEVRPSAPLQGIGIFFPRNRDEYERYRSLPFYAATRFWDHVPYRIAEA